MGMEERRWYAVQVKPRHEKTVASLLRGRGVEEFLPLYAREQQWSDRRKIVQFPLFPLYTFCRLGGAEHSLVLQVPGVRSLVGFNNHAVPVGEEEIEMVRAMVASRLPLSPGRALVRGKRVRVNRGPLAGCEGILERKGNRHRMVVTLSLLRRSVAVEIDPEWVTMIAGSQESQTTGGWTRAWTPQRLRRAGV